MTSPDSNKKTVVAVHTAMPMVEPTKALFEKHIPNARLVNIVDDSLIQDVIAAGEVTPAVEKRLQSYYQNAVDAGADLIFNTCSSVGDTAEAARAACATPIVKIDDAMALDAVRQADAVGVLATVPTTLGPTVRLVHRQADAIGKQVKVVEGLAEGAFDALLGGDAAKHDALILETAKRVAAETDVLVLAQGSMARMEQALADATGKPVLSSPESGVRAVQAALAELGD